ncbi:hypothetical protein FCM35_KLT13398 [Carex littledalei]|uniref:Uncharacterized protein n=1 Tax=Carex littledalei TaxID=544730 RepID=A0A833V3F5_9POAL|nr:hypothetical protein FCM35_KLT13398 [Carex littledalei]
MGSFADGNTAIEFVLDADDELEEGEIREVEERSIGHFQNFPSYLDDLEEVEIREEKVVEENMVHAQNAPAYFDDLEEGEIREQVRLFHEERESSQTDHARDNAKDPKDNSLTRQVKEFFSKRFRDLLSLQDFELRKFKLLRKVHEMEFEVNCSDKLSIQDFKILGDMFNKHMKAQHRTFISVQIDTRNRENKLNEQWLEKAREGTLEGSFCELPLPCSGFKMKKFDYRSEMEDILAKNGSDDMHLDVVEDEGSLGSETLLEAQVESDHMIAEVSQCNDNALNVTCLDCAIFPKYPSISIPSSNFESEEMSIERNEIGCDETALGVPETRVENINLTLNPNSPQAIMPNPNFECDEGTLEAHELASTDTASIGLAEANMNTNSLPGNVHSDQIVVSDTSHVPTRSLECQRLSTEGNIIAETPLINQNEPPVEQLAPQMRAPDVDILPQLLQMVRHDLSIDPLQNELTTLRKLQKALSERHNEEMARLKAEYEKELDNTRRKYHQMEVEADAQLSGHRAHLNMVYQKVCMHCRLAEEFQHMFYRPNLIGQLPMHGTVGPQQFPPPSQPQFSPHPILRPATPFVAEPLSTSNYGLVPNPYAIPQLTQPRATFAVAPTFEQRPVLPMQSFPNFLNQSTLMHSSLAGAPIGGLGPRGVCGLGIPQYNRSRPSSLS